MQNTSAFLQGISGTEVSGEAAPSASGDSVDEAAVMAAVKRDDVNEVRTVATRLGADPAKVGEAVEKLSQEGFIDQDQNGLRLTDAGERFIRYRNISKA